MTAALEAERRKATAKLAFSLLKDIQRVLDSISVDGEPDATRISSIKYTSFGFLPADLHLLSQSNVPLAWRV